jgi:hypothetical protein
VSAVGCMPLLAGAPQEAHTEQCNYSTYNPNL